ncbi:MAG: hypothetical protein AB1502_10170 [Thermodesulfobacteriota bacterium]
MKGSIRRTVFGITEFAPIIVFGYLASADSVDLRERFLIGGMLALTILVTNRVIKWHMNSLALATNIFLLIEGLAFTIFIEVIAIVQGFLRESAIFIVAFVIGLIRTIVSPCGFLDVEAEDPSAVKRGSVYLLVAVLGGLGMSILFRGQERLSAALPFIVLLFLQRVLRENLRKGMAANE